MEGAPALDGVSALGEFLPDSSSFSSVPTTSQDDFMSCEVVSTELKGGASCLAPRRYRDLFLTADMMHTRNKDPLFTPGCAMSSFGSIYVLYYRHGFDDTCKCCSKTVGDHFTAEGL